METRATHRSVLPDEVIQLLCPGGRSLIVDCTLGLGGHAEALLAAAGPEARLIGIDLDESFIKDTKDRLKKRFGDRVRVFVANFRDLDEVLRQAGEPAADVIIADLGVCSAQLDQPDRGLSFQVDGPLDMRMGTLTERTAADLVNRMGQKELADLIYANGEERFSRRIAKAIVTARTRKRIERTGELAEIVAKAIPAVARRTRRRLHPATRTFQALRIAVNDELASLDRLLAVLPGAMTIGGRAGIISFHSLEDRRVKQAFARLGEVGIAKLLTKKPITPGEEEKLANPRSRSAKLRGIERIA